VNIINLFANCLPSVVNIALILFVLLLSWTVKGASNQCGAYSASVIFIAVMTSFLLSTVTWLNRHVQ